MNCHFHFSLFTCYSKYFISISSCRDKRKFILENAVSWLVPNYLAGCFLSAWYTARFPNYVCLRPFSYLCLREVKNCRKKKRMARDAARKAGNTQVLDQFVHCPPGPHLHLGVGLRHNHLCTYLARGHLLYREACGLRWGHQPHSCDWAGCYTQECR